MADLALLSLFAGLYSVPMYALIQMRSAPSHRARIIAANNILNALFMIASSVIVGAAAEGASFTIPQVFLVVGLLNAIVAFYIFMLVPEYLLRFVAFVAARLVYRFKVRGDEHIPTEGAAILVCNHVSFVDPVLLMAASPRPIRFIMDHQIFKTAGARLVLPPRQGDPDRAAEGRRPGDLRAGVRARPRRCSTTATCSASSRKARSTRDGQLAEFKGGVMQPARERTRCRSFRSRCRTCGARSSRAPAARRCRSRSGAACSAASGWSPATPVPAAAVTPAALRERVGRSARRR